MGNAWLGQNGDAAESETTQDIQCDARRVSKVEVQDGFGKKDDANEGTTSRTAGEGEHTGHVGQECYNGKEAVAGQMHAVSQNQVKSMGSSNGNKGEKLPEEEWRAIIGMARKCFGAMSVYAAADSHLVIHTASGTISILKYGVEYTVQHHGRDTNHFVPYLDVVSYLVGVSREGGTAEIEGTVPTASALLRLIERQGFRCALSGAELTPDDCEADHIVPLNDGGSHGIANIQFVTKKVNRCKGTLSTGDFIELCQQVSEHAATNPPTGPTSH